MEKGEDFPEKEEWLMGGTLPAAVARLVQCLAEEAEASPETLAAALQIIALFARGRMTQVNWRALSRGPYGEELLHQAWLLYAPMMASRRGYFLAYTLAELATFRQPENYWSSNEGQLELLRLLRSQSSEEITRGLFTGAGLMLAPLRYSKSSELLLAVERHLFQEDPALWQAATLAWGRSHYFEASREPSPEVLDRLLSLWLIEAIEEDHPVRDTPGHDPIASFALGTQLGCPRKIWTPELTVAQKQLVWQAVDRSASGRSHEVAGALMVAFHARDVWTEEELAWRLNAVRENIILPPHKKETAIDTMLEQMGEAGRRYLRASVVQRQKRKWLAR